MLCTHQVPATYLRRVVAYAIADVKRRDAAAAAADDLLSGTVHFCGEWHVGPRPVDERRVDQVEIAVLCAHGEPTAVPAVTEGVCSVDVVVNARRQAHAPHGLLVVLVVAVHLAAVYVPPDLVAERRDGHRDEHAERPAAVAAVAAIKLACSTVEVRGGRTVVAEAVADVGYRCALPVATATTSDLSVPLRDI